VNHQVGRKKTHTVGYQESNHLIYTHHSSLEKPHHYYYLPISAHLLGVVAASRFTSIEEEFSAGSSMILEVEVLVDGLGNFFSKHLLKNFGAYTFACA